MTFSTFPLLDICIAFLKKIRPIYISSFSDDLEWLAETYYLSMNSKAKATLPISLCTKSCLPGNFRRKQEGKQFCCYDCLPCPKEKMSSQIDMDDCSECPADQYPSKDQDSCLPKRISFLSYSEPMGRSLSGDIIIGAITSLLFMFQDPATFFEDPHHSFIREPIFSDDLEWLAETYYLSMNSKAKAIWMTVLNVQQTNIQAKTKIHVFQREYLSYPIQNQWEEIIYGSHPEMPDQSESFSFYQMVPDEGFEYKGLCHLLLHFGWIWVGILVKEDDGGRFVRMTFSMFPLHGICIAFLKKLRPIYISSFSDDVEWLAEIYYFSMNSKAKALHQFLKRISFNNNVGDEILFDEKRELIVGFDVINWVTFPNQSFHRIWMIVLNVQKTNIQTKTKIHVFQREYLSYPIQNQWEEV
ncbi:hypothetical protein E2320_003022 [Naja naja]|nr:hypothetical protein E2320_003022 [Naja naja]